MLHVYQIGIELHDPVFFASREMGYLFETAPYIHNYALTYALEFACSPWHSSVQVPLYKAQLEPLNDEGIYVFPAISQNWGRVIEVWKYERSGEWFHRRQSTQSDTAVNLPLLGRSMSIAIGTMFQSYVVSHVPLLIPRWIRLGKTASKCEVFVKKIDAILCLGSFYCSHPLNPLDAMDVQTISAYDVVNMPPTSLIKNIHCYGEYFNIGDECIPANMEYVFHD